MTQAEKLLARLRKKHKREYRKMLDSFYKSGLARDFKGMEFLND